MTSRHIKHIESYPAVVSHMYRKLDGEQERTLKERTKIIPDPIGRAIEWYIGPCQDTNWYEACDFIANLKVDGGGWRMPAFEELQGITVDADDRLHPWFRKITWGDHVWAGDDYDPLLAGCFSFGLLSGGAGRRVDDLANVIFAVRSRR